MRSASIPVCFLLAHGHRLHTSPVNVTGRRCTVHRAARTPPRRGRARYSIADRGGDRHRRPRQPPLRRRCHVDIACTIARRKRGVVCAADDVRAGVRRAPESGGHAVGGAARQPARARGVGLSSGTSRGGRARCRRRACHVRHAGVGGRYACRHGARAMVERGAGRVRSDWRGGRVWAACAQATAAGCGGLYRSGVLVHRFVVAGQSSVGLGMHAHRRPIRHSPR